MALSLLVQAIPACCDSKVDQFVSLKPFLEVLLLLLVYNQKPKFWT